jgi:integrase
MYIEYLKDGSVKYRLPYVDALTGKTKRVSIKYDKDNSRNRKRAEEELQRRIEELTDGAVKGNITIEKAIEKYIDFKSLTLRQSTIRRNQATLNRILDRFPKGTLLNRVTAVMWQKCLLELSESRAGTYNEYLTRLKGFLKWCYSAEYLESIDYINRMQPLPAISRHQKAAEKYLEEEEVKELLQGMAIDQWRLLTEFLILSGLRVGEALALELADLKAGSIAVNKTYDCIGDIVTPPKTPESIRDVYIQPELADCIRRIKAYRMKQLKRYRIQCPLLFFEPESAGHCQYYAYNKYLKSNSKRILGHEITPHALRHTSASLLMAAGVPIEVISRRLGHVNSKVTKEIYLHVTEKLKEKDAKLLQSVQLLSI